jgi:hypothetical protein
MVELDETAVDIHPYANAFRVVEAEPGSSECFLDFLFLSPEEDRASVVSRIRVRNGFLPTIKTRLTFALDGFLFP